MKNIFKVVLLFVVGFGFLIYFTIPSSIKEDKSDKELDFKYIPSFFDVVNGNNYTKKDDFFKNFPIYLIVLNHDTLAVFSELYKKNLNENIVFVANISNTPWFIKQLAVNGKLEEMYKESKIPLINDSNGAFMNSLALNDNTQNKYIIFKLKSDGNIEKLKEGFVELNILEKGISAEDSKKSLEEIIKIF